MATATVASTAFPRFQNVSPDIGREGGLGHHHPLRSPRDLNGSSGRKLWWFLCPGGGTAEQVPKADKPQPRVLSAVDTHQMHFPVKNP
ncbi:MAG: hypothetical protein R3C12_15775 [Planctomycetaceae bacterium]